jgi:hypothetical protein
MISHRIRAALVAYLDQCKPDASIAVCSGNQFDDAALPRLTVTCAAAEPHSMALHQVARMTFEITLRAHAKDDATHSELSGWLDQFEQALNAPELVTALVSQTGQQISIFSWSLSSGVDTWEDAVLAVTWEARCHAERVG